MNIKVLLEFYMSSPIDINGITHASKVFAGFEHKIDTGLGYSH